MTPIMSDYLSDRTRDVTALVARADELRKSGKIEDAIPLYLKALSDPPQAGLCLKLARSYEELGNIPEACRWALAVVDAEDDFTSWQTASRLVQRYAHRSGRPLRSAKLALLGSYTTAQLSQLLTLAAGRRGMQLEIFESQYGQYEQDIIDPNSRLYAFDPDFIVLAVHEGDLRLPEYSAAPQESIRAEVARWTSLWRTVKARSRARIVQHNFALPCDVPMGHLAARLSGSRYMMTQAVNTRLGEEAGTAVSIVDCERLASFVGKARWFDPRFWHLAKQAVALQAVPALARHTAAVIGADLGLSRKCLVLDLDNTLWGGVIAEDGLAGIKLGNGVDGEAFVAFQEYILKLKRKGVILAVCSKNNHADAMQPFEKHPEMRLKRDDIAVFVANWEPKPQNIRKIAQELGIGLDALVFVDDNPVEREAMRQFVPEVEVVPLPDDASYYVRALAQCLSLETSSYTQEDAARAEQYQARAQIRALEATAGSIEEFYQSLHMQAIIAPFDALHLPRVAQLIGKTNQFNLTTKRHGMPQLESFVSDPTCVHLYLRLRDRFADHGLVALIIALRKGTVLDIDTWLMSCRVIGRTVEATIMERVCRQAEALGCTSLRGTYVPSEKNAMAEDAYAKLGFTLVSQAAGQVTWSYDLLAKGPISNRFVKTVDEWEVADGGA
ncbi:MAG: Methoxymalonyl-ACP biosynthesis protein FkbH [Nitrospira sp.]|nr:MAG: Methoxymalonyl-ACP biosynthesis protein FkbH [Nitrospira sp.]